MEQTTLSDPRKRMTVEKTLSEVQRLRREDQTGRRTGGRKKVLLYKTNEGKKAELKSSKTITKTSTITKRKARIHSIGSA